MSSILITGGAGYIGSKISYDLTDRGFKICIVDNLSTGHKKLINPKAKFFKCNISNQKKIKQIIQKYKIDTIIHCAASLDVEESMRKKKKYYLNNVIRTRKLLRASNGLIKNFIFSSTCAVYDTSKKYIVDEKTKTKPKSYYGKTKLIAEKYIKLWSKKNNSNYAILRYFNVAGSDEKLRCGCINNNNQLIKTLSSNVTKKKFSINLYGNNYNTKDGTCIRDYIHVSDLSKFHILTLGYLIKKKKSVLFNCGYGRGYSVLDIIKAFEKKIKRKILINSCPRRKGDLDKIYCNASYTKKKLSINFKFKSISDIVSSTLLWEKKIHEKR